MHIRTRKERAGNRTSSIRSVWQLSWQIWSSTRSRSRQAFCHDVVEDTVMTEEELTEEFGPEVSLIVSGVTKLAQLKYSADKVEEQAENLRKMFLAMAQRISALFW